MSKLHDVIGGYLRTGDEWEVFVGMGRADKEEARVEIETMQRDGKTEAEIRAWIVATHLNPMPPGTQHGPDVTESPETEEV